MPMLTSNNHDEVDGTRSSLRDEDIPEMDQVSEIKLNDRWQVYINSFLIAFLRTHYSKTTC